jgi:hypothetical protein
MSKRLLAWIELNWIELPSRKGTAGPLLQVKLRLLRLAARYDRYLNEIDTGKSHSIVPESDASTDADEGADIRAD